MTENQTSTHIQAIFYGIYHRVLQSVNVARHQAKMYSVSTLQLEDPSYAQIVIGLKNAINEIEVVNPIESAKLKEYVELMDKLADAITAGNQSSLDEVVELLDSKPFI